MQATEAAQTPAASATNLLLPDCRPSNPIALVGHTTDENQTTTECLRNCSLERKCSNPDISRQRVDIDGITFTSSLPQIMTVVDQRSRSQAGNGIKRGIANPIAQNLQRVGVANAGWRMRRQ
ncbi:MAG TPA: hypothetical protein VF513_15710 [Stenotrophomonas sp.]